jgi:hypothetical protein
MGTGTGRDDRGDLNMIPAHLFDHIGDRKNAGSYVDFFAKARSGAAQKNQKKKLNADSLK